MSSIVYSVSSSNTSISSQSNSHYTPLDYPPETISPTSSLPSQSHNIHPIVTQAKNGISKPKVLLSTLTIMKRNNVQEALVHKKWHSTVYDEYNALVKNQTWSLVYLPFNRCAVGC